ncbi:MAG: hypothetical protein R3D85_16420 [Paracoccaceae bacterium]|nr:hypothetical protein [Paracoccaceae bacterium]MCB2132361.1 hypothetical protein [Paracoccaceae bacterium]MCB2138086.1 hypothetical protein [Paracoccaceae bacterium]MCB2159948.1 hypothetical protein [Paracoccaceae bacterium]
MTKARIVRLAIETMPTGMLFATSPDMKELQVSGRTAKGLCEVTKNAIAAIYEARGEAVEVIEAQADEAISPAWVVLLKSDPQLTACGS